MKSCLLGKLALEARRSFRFDERRVTLPKANSARTAAVELLGTANVPPPSGGVGEPSKFLLAMGFMWIIQFLAAKPTATVLDTLGCTEKGKILVNMSIFVIDYLKKRDKE